MSRIATVPRAVFWAATWGVGVALGVALGGWLTVVGGASAPGTESLDLAEDILVLPGIAGGAVFVLHLIGQSIAAAVRSARPSHRTDDEDPARK